MSQVWEAIKDKIPIAQRHKSSVGFATTLEILFINSQYEWEKVGLERLAENQIIDRELKLRKMKQDTRKKHFPNGFTPPGKFANRATEIAEEYFHKFYSGEPG